MRERVFGIETEYALIYHRAPGDAARPTNLQLYTLFEQALAARVRSLPRAFSLLRAKQGRFLENGASFHYEATAADFEQGLLEMASPECRDPFELLRCERAKDRLAEQLAGDVNARLARLGLAGRVSVGKNNVDSQGHTFGSHESYWVEDRLSAGERARLLPLWAGAWLVTLPAFAWLGVATLALLVAVIALLLLPVVAVLGAVLAALLRRPLPRLSRGLAHRAAAAARVPERVARRLQADPGALARALAFVEAPLRPAVALHSALHNRFHFRRFRDDLTAFLVTRTAFAGAGAVAFDGGPLLRLAQRPPFLRTLARIFTSGDERPLYESRDVFFRPWSAFASRRRLHLLLGDANLCDWALVLRVGTTALVLEVIESGRGPAWPRLADPLQALRSLNRDPELATPLPLAGGGMAAPLAIQRRYLAGVRRALLAAPGAPPDPWKLRILAMWEETLQLLERDPEALADRLDWVAKRALLRADVREPGDRAALAPRGAALLSARREDLDDEGRRLRELAYRALRTDLRYHELGPRGGHRRLLRRGAVRELASEADVARALREPPGDTRAHGRGLAIREASRSGRSGGATWHRVRVGASRWRFFTDPLRPGPTLSLG